MGQDGGARRSAKRRRNRVARAGVVSLAVAATEAVLIGALDLTGSAVHTPRTTADEASPYYLTAKRTPAPKAHVAERRPPRKRRAASPATTGLASPPAQSASPSAPGVRSSPSAVGPPAPDYGRWTVAPGAWPEAGPGENGISVCDPANLASLPEEARKACVETLRTAAAGPPARRGPAQDWANHSPFSCSAPKNEPAHKWLFDHCHGLRMKYRF